MTNNQTFSCHDADACALGQLPCPTPDVCGCGAPCPVKDGTHQPAEALHQIAEPAAPVGKPIEDAIDALVMAAFTEGGCSEHRMLEARIQTELRKKELRTLLSTPQPCSRSHPHEEMTPMCELRTEIARLTNALARAEAQLAAAQQAVQDAPLPLLVRDIARDLGITVPQACIALKPLGNYSTNSAVTAEMAKLLRDSFPATAHPAEGVPAQDVEAKIGELLALARRMVRAALDADNKTEMQEIKAAIDSEVEFERALRNTLAATHPTQQELEAQTAHMADLVELADYATKKLEASQAQRVPLSDAQIHDWWRSENNLEDCDMCRFADFAQVVRAFELKYGITQEKQG